MLCGLYSLRRGIGLSVVSALVARSLGRRCPVLLVDAAGGALAPWGVEEPPVGIRHIVAAGADAEADVVQRVAVSLSDQVDFLGHGSTQPAPSGSAQSCAPVVTALRADGRTVLVDVGVELGGTSSDEWDHLRSHLRQRCDRTILVSRLGREDLELVHRGADRPSAVVAVRERGRGCRPRDLADLVGAPLLTTVEVDPALGRSIDCRTFPRVDSRAADRSAAAVARWLR